MFDSSLRQQLNDLDAAAESYATEFVDALLTAARQAGVSDVHLQPVAEGLKLLWRVDGVLQLLGTFPQGKSSHVVSRLKVLAELLTYRNDIPQEGRIRRKHGEVEMRVSTFPTLHGERAVIRLFATPEQLLYLDQLGLPDDLPQRLRQLLAETSGAILVTGPAGSGKSTTSYACLRELAQTTGGGRSIVSLEDPIEVAVDGVAQSQVNAPAGLTLASGLKSLLRQDPEVILVGEIRDRETAEVCMQASLTGQLVLTTFHAETTAGAIGRLSDMGIEPYLLRSGVLAILSQRLVRRLCACALPCSDPNELLGLDAARAASRRLSRLPPDRLPGPARARRIAGDQTGPGGPGHSGAARCPAAVSPGHRRRHGAPGASRVGGRGRGMDQSGGSPTRAWLPSGTDRSAMKPSAARQFCGRMRAAAPPQRESTGWPHRPLPRRSRWIN